ncbi:uncharacterized protein LOC101236114 [Hydra vulgaris]|uniref:uncharacterized protein LOC101236114 n=1 Tax=Hydra vulgaris TaxID=6087 RepID=UPI0002B48266|nr:uncharacterized protein LOC101236114 [Hydra vulgaris]
MRIINNFSYRIKKRKHKFTGSIRTEELLHAELMCVKTEQLIAKKLNTFSDICQSLNLKYDSDGVLRLNKRFPNVLVELDIKHPIYIQTYSMFTKLLILRAHEKTGHAGINSTLNEILKRCIACKKVQGKTFKGPEPPVLPEYRVNIDFAFANAGVDFAGPFFIKDIYVHLELTPRMDVPSVICALKRFFARRAYVKMFINDNFSSFKSKELSRFLCPNLLIVNLFYRFPHAWGKR